MSKEKANIYPTEFRESSVKLLIESDQPIAQTARELGVNPTWYGEIPRTYFYDADHQRIAISGLFEPGHLETWLSTLRR